MTGRGLDPARWQRARALFDEAIELPAALRLQLLERECADDAALREEVESLLAADAAVVELPTQAVAEQSEAMLDELAGQLRQSEVDAFIGTQLGPWRVEKALGVGGMGSVYLGRRTLDDFDQLVAIKLVRSIHLVNADVLRRFVGERQILAQLDHPYIARLLDGGALAGGMPYLVMEYVEGQRIDRHCAAAGLDLGARVGLFVKVCRAVQAAHRALVVHRDLKPDNILIDGHGEPKLLDFGIAKVLGEVDQGQTQADRRMFTPAYAAPEQFDGMVSVATDVYALGVILYELLTGVSPYGDAGGNSLQLMAAIRTQEPTPPSRLLSRQAQSGERPAARRLGRQLRGDLDAIVGKALRKLPAERYASVGALIDDLERFLDHRPVGARQGSRWYVARKFAERHRLALALAGMLLIGALAIALNWRWQRDQVTQERDKAQQVVRLLQELFAAGDPFRAQGKPVTVAELVERGATRLQSDTGTAPEVRAELALTLSRVLQGIGDYPRSLALVELAQANQTEASAIDLRLRTLQRSGEVLVELNRMEDARASYSGMLETAELLGESGLLARADALAGLARSWRAGHDPARGLPLIEQAIALQLRGLGAESAQAMLPNLRLTPEHEDMAVYLHEHCQTLVDLGKADAEQVCLATEQFKLKLFGEDHLRLLSTLNALAVWYDSQGNSAKAIELMQRILAIQLPALGPDHPQVGVVRLNLGATFRSLQRYDEAGEQYAEALRIFETSRGLEHPHTLMARNNLANLHYARGAFAEALALHEQVGEVRARALDAGHRDLATSYYNIAKCQYRLGQLEAARVAFQRALDAFQLGGHPAEQHFSARLGLAMTKVDATPAEALSAAQKLAQDIHASGQAERTAAVAFLRARAEAALGRIDAARASAAAALAAFATDDARDFASPEEVTAWVKALPIGAGVD